MILSVSDSSQSEGGQIPLISLDLYKQSIPLRDEGHCSFSPPARSQLHSLYLSITFWMQMGLRLLGEKRERRNILSVKNPAIPISVRALSRLVHN